MRVRRAGRGWRVWLAATHVCAIGLVVGGTSLAAAAGAASTPTVPTIPPSDLGPELPTASVPGLAPGATPPTTAGTTPPTSSTGSGAGGSGGANDRRGTGTQSGGSAGTRAGGSANTPSSPAVSPGASGGGPSISSPSVRPVGATRRAAGSAPRRAEHRGSWPVAASVLVSLVSLAVAAFCTRRRWQGPLRQQWRNRIGHRRSGLRAVSPNPGVPRLVTGESTPGARLGGTSGQGATLDPADAAVVREALTELATRDQVRQ
jgi:hypothetical protein